jgi:TonB family protein
MIQRPATALLSLLYIASATFATAQFKPQRVRVSESVMKGMVIKKVTPEYPADAKAQKIEGAVVLQATIGKEGNVENLQLISGHPLLAPVAIDAVKQWKYKPFLLNGEAVIVETQVTVNFTLADKAPAGVGANAPAKILSVVPGGSGPVGGIVESTPPADAPRTGVPQRIRVSAGVESGLIVTKVQPEYPEEARQQAIEGVVLLQATIDKEGNVAKLQLISGHPLLAPAAIEAVKQWKYRPYLLNGNPLEVETQIQVNFTLQK